VPQPPQRRCASFGSPHLGQLETDAGVNASWARLFLVREWECLRFGKATFQPPEIYNLFWGFRERNNNVFFIDNNFIPA
jgi:hypothetical protein